MRRLSGSPALKSGFNAMVYELNPGRSLSAVKAGSGAVLGSCPGLIGQDGTRASQSLTRILFEMNGAEPPSRAGLSPLRMATAAAKRALAQATRPAEGRTGLMRGGESSGTSPALGAGTHVVHKIEHKHGVCMQEVRQAITSSLQGWAPNGSRASWNSEPRFALMGITATGRVLLVICAGPCPDGFGSTFQPMEVVTAFSPCSGRIHQHRLDLADQATRQALLSRPTVGPAAPEPPQEEKT